MATLIGGSTLTGPCNQQGSSGLLPFPSHFSNASHNHITNRDAVGDAAVEEDSSWKERHGASAQQQQQMRVCYR